MKIYKFNYIIPSVKIKMNRLLCVLMILVAVTQTVAIAAFSDHITTYHIHQHDSVDHSHDHTSHNDSSEDECPTCNFLVSASFHSLVLGEGSNLSLVTELSFKRFEAETVCISLVSFSTHQIRAPPVIV